MKSLSEETYFWSPNIGSLRNWPDERKLISLLISSQTYDERISYLLVLENVESTLTDFGLPNQGVRSGYEVKFIKVNEPW